MNLQEQEYSKRLDLNVWKRLLQFARPYRRQLIILIGQMFLLGLVDAVMPLFNRYAIDKIALTGRLERLIPFGLIALVVIVLQALNVRLMILYAGRLECFIPYDIRKAAFAKLQTMPLAYYDQTPVGWLLARLTSDSRRLGETLSWNVIDLFWSLAMMILMMVFMLLLNVKLALMVLVTVPILVAVSILFQKRIIFNFRKVRKFNSHVTAGFNEGITGAKTIKSLSIEDAMHREFQETTGTMRNFAVRAATVSAVYTPIVLLLGAIATGLVLWRGGIQVETGLPGSIGYGTMVAFISYAVQFFDPVKQFARVFTELNYAQASAERVMSVIDMEAGIRDNELVEQTYGDMLNSNREQWPDFAGNITFEDVTFRYKDGENILEHFNLTVRAGEKIAIVGETGSGKTTLVNLACRFYEPTEGRILVDGVDYRERPLLWMYANLGYVLQEPHLFSGSVRDNIAYGRQEVSDEMIEKAARIVNAHDFIMAMDKGYASEVGERGSRLSTGQKQLISFARAILSDPGMFVLDEATSSVDTETEQLIHQAMQNALRGRTSFIIAHRLSTIRSADRILVIDKGKIVEEGNQRELLQLKGVYWRLYTNQFMREQMRLTQDPQTDSEVGAAV
ncbi:MAG: ABC transporter ATP-binding protein [Clostridiaceae bacterium]|nr:ABC transporter ATP-binding protein [Clostridiaceae bacterium]